MRSTTGIRTARPASLQRRQRTRTLLHELQRAATAVEREAAIEEIVRLNMEVAHSIASRYRGRGIPAEDLDQVAYVGLVGAVRRYQPGLGGDFLSFAVPTIRGEVRKYFRDHGWTVRPPRSIQDLQAAATRARAQLEQMCGEHPDLQALAAAMGEPVEQVAEALAAEGCFTPTSLDQPLRSDAALALGDAIASTEDGYDAAEARAMLEPALRRLRQRDLLVVKLRFFDGLTQHEIGARIGVTQMQVSRLLSRILRDLRADLVAPPLAAS